MSLAMYGIGGISTAALATALAQQVAARKKLKENDLFKQANGSSGPLSWGVDKLTSGIGSGSTSSGTLGDYLLPAIPLSIAMMATPSIMDAIREAYPVDSAKDRLNRVKKKYDKFISERLLPKSASATPMFHGLIDAIVTGHEKRAFISWPTFWGLAGLAGVAGFARQHGYEQEYSPDVIKSQAAVDAIKRWRMEQPHRLRVINKKEHPGDEEVDAVDENTVAIDLPEPKALPPIPAELANSEIAKVANLCKAANIDFIGLYQIVHNLPEHQKKAALKYGIAIATPHRHEKIAGWYTDRKIVGSYVGSMEFGDEWSWIYKKNGPAILQQLQAMGYTGPATMEGTYEWIVANKDSDKVVQFFNKNSGILSEDGKAALESKDPASAPAADPAKPTRLPGVDGYRQELINGLNSKDPNVQQATLKTLNELLNNKALASILSPDAAAAIKKLAPNGTLDLAGAQAAVQTPEFKSITDSAYANPLAKRKMDAYTSGGDAGGGTGGDKTEESNPLTQWSGKQLGIGSALGLLSLLGIGSGNTGFGMVTLVGALVTLFGPQILRSLGVEHPILDWITDTKTPEAKPPSDKQGTGKTEGGRSTGSREPEEKNKPDDITPPTDPVVAANGQTPAAKAMQPAQPGEATVAAESKAQEAQKTQTMAAEANKTDNDLAAGVITPDPTQGESDFFTGVDLNPPSPPAAGQGVKPGTPPPPVNPAKAQPVPPPKGPVAISADPAIAKGIKKPTQAAPGQQASAGAPSTPATPETPAAGPKAPLEPKPLQVAAAPKVAPFNPAKVAAVLFKQALLNNPNNPLEKKPLNITNGKVGRIDVGNPTAKPTGSAAPTPAPTPKG